LWGGESSEFLAKMPNCELGYQQGSVKMRDLDFVNPRPKMPSSALPPEIRAKLGLDRAKPGSNRSRGSSGTRTPPESQGRTPSESDVYHGASNVAKPLAGASGAGTDWENPHGHAFVRRGTNDRRIQALRDAAQKKRDRLDAVNAVVRDDRPRRTYVSAQSLKF
jgi:hypothetical protein